MRCSIFYLVLFPVLSFPVFCLAQSNSDTTRQQKLKAVTISAYKLQLPKVETLPDVHHTYLLAGKRTEVIDLHDLNANTAEKTARQLFARVPGVFVYDMDGSGNQVNISTRGLDPHRSWEFNIRQNGIMTNSDIYGYPASHYSMPMEAVQRIELVRGTASLQYGAEFGGMINYIIKQPDTSRTLGLENIMSVGSFGLVSAYQSVGGRSGKWQYQGYFSFRRSDGYRDNSASKYDAQFASVSYFATPALRFTAEIGRSNYLYQLPGQLTDSMFLENPRQSTRSRNYYGPEIWVPSFKLNWQITERSKVEWTTSAVLGERRSVLFDAFATVPDAIDPATGQYKARSVDIDAYHSYTSELRFLQEYRLGALQNILAAGIRYINNDLHRQQQGKGTTGSDFDLTLTQPVYGRDMHLKTQNVAIYLENQFKPTAKLTLSPGVRIEKGLTRMIGEISYLEPLDVPNNIEHAFPLFGLTGQYQITPRHRLFAGWSQAYRPVIFKDIVPGSVLERADKNLKDATGYNAEIGVSGSFGARLKYNLSAFQLQIKNRMGNLLETDDAGNTYIYKTNIGNSLTQGVEAFVQVSMWNTPVSSLAVFSSTAYLDAYYQDAHLHLSGENRDISGNRVESAPRWISRNGVDLAYKKWSVNVLYSYTAGSFSDPANTVLPSANGAVGLVPAYSLWDIGLSFRLRTNIILKGTVSNLFDLQYFTKRPQFYPGPGIWPSDGRSIQFTIQSQF